MLARFLNAFPRRRACVIFARRPNHPDALLDHLPVRTPLARTYVVVIHGDGHLKFGKFTLQLGTETYGYTATCRWIHTEV